MRTPATHSQGRALSEDQAALVVLTARQSFPASKDRSGGGAIDIEAHNIAFGVEIDHESGRDLAGLGSRVSLSSM
jgi:hypothetical protein